MEKKHHSGHRSILFLCLEISLVLLLALGTFQVVRADPGVIYVDQDATGANDGSSWADAYVDLQDALAMAVYGDEIWVAEGIYLPMVEHGGTGDRFKSFQLKNGMALYGGFDPSQGDVAWEDRDWAGNVTVLSGDIDNNDITDPTGVVTSTANITGNNSYHVFYHPDGTALDSSAVLDGFTISGGNAAGDSYPHEAGGGMFNTFSSSPTLANCTFTGNSASSYGGGVFNTSSSSPTLTNCTFTGNSAYSGGGMYNASFSSPTLASSTFTDNSASSGGGMYNDYFSSPALTDCTFTGNSAGSGGGMYNISSSPTLTNCTLAGNTAISGGGMYNISSSPMLTNTTFTNNLAHSGHGGGMYNQYYSSPTLTNTTFTGNSAFGYGGGMYNASFSSPSLTNCVFTGNSAYPIGGGMYNDSFTSPALTNCTFSGNLAPFSGGIGNYFSSPTLTNVILWGNTPEDFENYESTTVITYSDIQGGCPPGAACTQVINADPLFANAAAGDLHLLPGSPAIDSGNSADCPAQDLDGLPRPSGLGCDMGAYEWRPYSYFEMSANDLTPEPGQVITLTIQSPTSIRIFPTQLFQTHFRQA